VLVYPYAIRAGLDLFPRKWRIVAWKDNRRENGGFYLVIERN
jgi:hypothetical protein